MNACNDKAWQLGISSLAEIEKIVHLVNVANFEIESGGMEQFFYNSSGDHAADTVPALVAVGAFDAASTLRAALAEFPGVLAPSESELRYADWPGSASIHEFTSAFYKQQPAVFELLCEFIDRNALALCHLLPTES